MKSQILAIATLVAVLIPNISSADEKTLMDYMDRDIDKFYVIAEKPGEMLIKIGATGGTFLFGDSDDKKALIDYCIAVGGAANLYPLESRTFEAQFMDRHTNIDCKAPNNKGFKGEFFRPSTHEKNYQNAWLDVTFEAPQAKSHFMKNFIKRNIGDTGNNIADVVKGNGLYYTFEYGTGMCEKNGGKYYMATDESLGYAVFSHDYLFAITHKQGNYKYEYAIGKHWCVDTADKSNEFTVEVLHEKNYNKFKPTAGVNRSEMKINTDPIPPYLMKDNADAKHAIAVEENALQKDYSMETSRAPSKEITALANKAIASQNTALGRQTDRGRYGSYVFRDE